MSDNHAFRYALAASLALHALLLFAFPEPVDTARRAASNPPQLSARLMEPELAPATAAPVEPVRREAPQVKKAAKPAPVEATPPPVVEAPESLSRDQYRVQLIDEARRHKRYPPLARENNWQGDVRVAVVIAMNGWPSVTLRGSSGYELLDRQAVEMFTLAARAVPVPPALRGKEFALDVRAVYDLED